MEIAPENERLDGAHHLDVAYVVDRPVADRAVEDRRVLGAQGWLALTTVDRESTTTVDRVFDQGDTWRVRFSGQALDGGTMVITRADLQQAGWKIAVPDDVGQRLTSNGATPSPLHTSVPAG